MKACIHIFITIILLTSLAACTKVDNNVAQRTYRMGFQNFAPRVDFDLYMQSLSLWTQRADAAIINTEVPWDSLLNGVTPQNFVNNNYKGLVNYYRAKNLKLWIYIDPENGLDRGSDALQLIARNKSIAQADMQQVYKNYVLAMDSILQPDHLGLALETNLIRAAAPDSIYQGVKAAANEAAQAIRLLDSKVKISVSVQVEYAWGKLGGTGAYVGVAQDFIDFPFMQELGLSSYPYFGFDKPAALPLNYYAKLTEGKALPVFVSEGGWSSHDLTVSSATITGDLQEQQDYIIRQGMLLDNAKAIGLFSLTFTDIDLTDLPPATPASIQYFAYLGLLDANMQPKPSLSSWDLLFKRRLQ